MSVGQFIQPFDSATASPPKAVRILPAGTFRASDGRPKEVEAWYIDSRIAAEVIASSFKDHSVLLIDYDHQSVFAKKDSSKIIPAAGWFSRVEWREGEGLFATEIKWNAPAITLISSKQYRFISPVFTYDKATGNVQRIINFTITNTPAIQSIFDLSQAAASVDLASLSALSKVCTQNQRGYELLAAMTRAGSNDTVVTPLTTNAVSQLCWSESALASPQNQRGIELLNKMRGANSI